MKEVKTPKKPIISYYLIILAVMLLFNFLIMPSFASRQIKNADYGEFMKMTEEEKIDKVQVEDAQILFTLKDSKTVYKTGRMDDPNLTERLYNAGITSFNKEIVEQMSPLLSLILSWVLPIAFFALLGHYMSKKLMDKAGGGNAMMFGMGKSNAKIYVQSTEGIKVSDVAVRTKQKRI